MNPTLTPAKNSPPMKNMTLGPIFAAGLLG